MICRLIHTKLWYPFRYINCTYYFEFDFHFNRFQLQDFKPTLFLTIITKSEVRFREAPCSACNYNDDTALVTLHKSPQNDKGNFHCQTEYTFVDILMLIGRHMLLSLVLCISRKHDMFKI